MHSAPGPRVFRGPDGAWYRAELAAQDPRTGRQLPGVQWLCYWTREGRWVGAVPVDAGRTMVDLEAEELIAWLGPHWR